VPPDAFHLLEARLVRRRRGSPRRTAPGVTRAARALGDAVEMPRAARSFALLEWPPAHNRIVPRGARYQDEGHCSARARWTLYYEHVFADSSAIRDGGRWGDGDVPSAYSSSHRAHDRHESVRGTRTRSCLFPTKTIGILSSGSLAARQQRQRSDFESEGRGVDSFQGRHPFAGTHRRERGRTHRPIPISFLALRWRG
jgi:hypothetical protein